MIKVTIALSIYNTAKYIRASLDSILAQTFNDYELLCIDDASTDGTWDILKEYAERDNRITLLRQETNKGLSVSRNWAMAEAKGQYLLMLDGDDLFAPVMVEKAYEKAQATNADMVIWDFVSFYCEDEIPQKCRQPSALAKMDVNDKQMLLRRPAFSPSRLLKTSTIRELGICFPEGLTKQDIPVHWKLVTSINKIALIPEYFLYYRQQPESTTNRRDRSVFSLAYVMDIVERQLNEDGIYEIFQDEFLRSRLSLLQGMYDVVDPEYKDEALEIVRAHLGPEEWTYINKQNNGLSFQERNFYGIFKKNIWAEFKYRSFNSLRSIYRRLMK